MNNKAFNFIKNFSYAITSNLISLLISTLVILIVPRLIGVEEYGYWQLYMFYSSYVGFMHFGWNDGIYLRYGGKEYKELNKNLFFSQFHMMFILQLTIAVIISITSMMLFEDENRIFIIQMTALCLLIVNVRTMLLFILQATNKIREYAMITVIGRILYFCLMIILLLIGVREYKVMIVADLTGKLMSLGFAVFYCRDIVFRSIFTFYFSFKEAIKNISVGIKLMFANIASMLIIGIVRFGIERTWDVTTFGKVSLTLSISNFMMLFINAIGIILFPVLRRADEGKLPSYYVTLRDLLMVVLLGALTLYFPLKVALSAWLPRYEDSLIFMALVFPMCVYEGKMALLINTYLKTLRKEKLMLRINVISLVLSLIITIVVTIVFKNLNLAIISIVVLLAFRSILAELFLSKILTISIHKDIMFEVIMTLIFIVVAWFLDTWSAATLYVVSYLSYMLIKRKDIAVTYKNIRSLVKD